MALYFTNPTKEDFVDHLTHEIENTEGSGLEQMFKSLFSRPAAKFLFNNAEVNDYQLFSKTYLVILNGFYKINVNGNWFSVMTKFWFNRPCRKEENWQQETIKAE